MRTHVVDHPLVAHKLTHLRDETTDSPTFRRLADELVTLLAYEATRDVRVARSRSRRRSPRRPGVAGLPAAAGRADPARRPGHARRDDAAAADRRVGFLGMIRNEETLEASTYAERLPEDLSGRQCYVLDPMLATGGTLAAAIRFLTDRGAGPHHRDLPARRPEGCARLEREARGPRRPGDRRHRRDGRAARTKGTSSRASATRATSLYGVVG